MMVDKWLHWPERHPFLWHIYGIVLIAVDLIGMAIECWTHDLAFILYYGVFGALALYMVHSKPKDDDDDQDEEEDDPNWPDGDVVDKWLRSRSKQPA